MARNFVAASSQYLIHTASPISAYPFTWACWYQHTADGLHTLCAFGNTGTSATEELIHFTGSLYAMSAGAAAAIAAASSSTNIWLHGAGVFAASNSRTSYAYDGTTKTKNTVTTSQAFGAVNRSLFGARMNIGAIDRYHGGRMAEVGLWNVALSEGEVDILRDGFSPLCVRPESLIGYWPLLGSYSPEIDIVGRYDMTLTNTPTEADHCRIIYPARGRQRVFGGASGVPRAMEYYRRRRAG